MKRATNIGVTTSQQMIISIHALVKRATFISGIKWKYKEYFNPRPREEGDTVCAYIIIKLNISIHALVKRATLCWISSMLKLQDFNPRPREEGDCGNFVKIRHANDFNPRPREEGDGNTTSNGKTNAYFNPRPREEGDFCGAYSSRGLLSISIHALVKRATQLEIKKKQ